MYSIHQCEDLKKDDVSYWIYENQIIAVAGNYMVNETKIVYCPFCGEKIRKKTR